MGVGVGWRVMEVGVEAEVEMGRDMGEEKTVAVAVAVAAAVARSWNLLTLYRNGLWGEGGE